MIGKAWQRLVKEALIAIYRGEQTRFSFNFPVYYFGFDFDLERLGMAVQSLQAIPEIPWPDEDCIILAEEVITSLLHPDVKGLTWIVHSKQIDDQFISPGALAAEAVITGAVFLANGQIVNGRSGYYYLSHVKVDPSSWTTTIEESIKKHAAQIQKAACAVLRQPDLTTVDTTLYEQYLRQTLVSTPGAYHWVAFDPLMSIPRIQGESRSPHTPMPGLAADFLGYISNLAVPCHYMLRSRFEKGFGPTGELKRLTKAKPIFSVIPYDRLYQQMRGPGEHMSEVAPHFRRGHIRHLWKEAGLNRLALPDDPKERLHLVHSHHVRRVYVHPAWIGDPSFASDDARFEVLTGEMPLRQL